MYKGEIIGRVWNILYHPFSSIQSSFHS